MGGSTPPSSQASGATPAVAQSGAMDINEVFRGGGRSVEFLDQINKACIIMLDETGIVPHAVAGRIASGIAQVIAQECERFGVSS